MFDLRKAKRIIAVALVLTPSLLFGQAPRSGVADPFAGFDLPDEWEDRFWAGPNAQSLLKLSPKEIRDLVPEQAGFRYCRCPACDAGEEDNPLIWSISSPKTLKCKVCGTVVPDSKAPSVEAPKAPEPPKPGEPAKPAAEPAKPADPPKSGEETIEVLPKITHHYPYFELPEPKQHYPAERVYLAAKADYEAREFLAKAALYAAVRYHEQARADKDPALAALTSLILVRFALVYPAYAVHFDQPNMPKFLQKADLAPPYRRGYKSAKWDWNGSLNVPLNLVIAYALIQDDPALDRAAEFLDVANPKQRIERDLFHAAADFTRHQPEEVNENGLQATRGILAVGRLLNDPLLVTDAITRLDRFAQAGFYYDGFWGKGTRQAHQRVMSQLDGWIERLLVGFRSPEPPNGLQTPKSPSTELNGLPLLALAREAGATILSETEATDVEVVSWPAPSTVAESRAAKLLGGTGIARLAIGEEEQGLDLELRGLDTFGPDQIQRQSLRLAAGGKLLLGDLDESPGLPNGFDRSSVSHNTVVVDGLNQRESLPQARIAASGGDFIFYAADPDFQVVTHDDPRAYPISTKRYRQTLIASSGPRNRYAVSIFEVNGGLQHDQYFHGPAESSARWRLPLKTTPGPSSLLPPSITYVPNARGDDDRWFVQSQGDFADLAETTTNRPTTATLITEPETNSGLRIHLLTTGSSRLMTATSPTSSSTAGRGSLVIRRRSTEGASMDSTFVTVFEPLNEAIPRLKRVGRVASSDSTVVIYLETADGPEELIVNLNPGKPCKVTLADSREFTMDGLAARVRSNSVVLAGGTFARTGDLHVEQGLVRGKIVAAFRRASEGSCGLFETNQTIPNPEKLVGRSLLISHGNGITRGWTIHSVQDSDSGARIFVREEPGFLIDSKSNEARYYQFPQSTFKGPHTFRVSLIARSTAN